MALFKIKKGRKADLPQTYNEGYCYLTTDDGKFYIDTSDAASGRIALNAAHADDASKWTTAKTISISSKAGTTGTNIDGSENANLIIPATMTDFNSITTKKLVVGTTTTTAHIAFQRESYNYLVAPKNGTIAFSPGSADAAGVTSGHGAHLAVTYGAILPGQNNNIINLGSEAYKWKNVYATTFTGKLNGNASTASKWATARDFTIGAKTKSVDGNANVSWDWDEIGVQRSKTLVFNETSYKTFVIPLCELTNTRLSADFFFRGSIYVKRHNILSYWLTRLDIECGKQYNTTDPVYHITVHGGMGPNWTPVTFTYNSIKYFGVKCFIKTTGYESSAHCYATGYATNWDIIEYTPIYNNQTSEIINQEIYNSLVELSGTTNVLPMFTFHDIRPRETEVFNLGADTYKWNAVYAKALYGNGANITDLNASKINAGTLPVIYGGTGKATLTAGEALIGAGTGAITTRGINNMTTKGYIAYDTKLMTTNTLAYWNGAYTSNGASNLAYCNQGAFGNIVTKSYTDSSSASAIGTGTSIPTERDIYYGLPTINNSHSYTSSTTIYAPNAGGTAGQYLKAAGATSTPTWASFGDLTLKTTDTAGTTTTIGTYNSSTAATLTITTEEFLPTYTSTHTSELSANEWITVTTPKGVNNEEMENGTYIIQVSTGIGEFYSGVMSWTKTTRVYTTIQYDEVVMHNAGTNLGYAHIGVRVYRDATTPKLQLCAIGDRVVSASASSPITIKMRRMI